jgi:hypothetical protein
MSLITRAKPQLRWGHGWTRNSSQEISIFRNEINVLLDFESGVNVARDFTGQIVRVFQDRQPCHQPCRQGRLAELVAAAPNRSSRKPQSTVRASFTNA